MYLAAVGTAGAKGLERSLKRKAYGAKGFAAPDQQER